MLLTDTNVSYYAGYRNDTIFANRYFSVSEKKPEFLFSL